MSTENKTLKLGYTEDEPSKLEDGTLVRAKSSSRLAMLSCALIPLLVWAVVVGFRWWI